VLYIVLYCVHCCVCLLVVVVCGSVVDIFLGHIHLMQFHDSNHLVEAVSLTLDLGDLVEVELKLHHEA